MGLPKFLKKAFWINKAATTAATKLGEQSQDPELPIGVLTRGRAWLERNKGKTGLIFIGITGWAFTQGCPDTYGIDWTIGVVTCDRIKYALGLVGAFLAGGGYLEPDAIVRSKQIMEGKLPDPRIAARAEVAVGVAATQLDQKKEDLAEAKAPAVGDVKAPKE